jgi:hypothetical protein
MDTIRYIKNKDIDKTLWDKCIARSLNGNTFAFSWFLDAACSNWDALVSGDYRSVMPIPIKKMLGLTFMKQPVFFNKSNIYIGNNKDISLFPNFLETLKKHVTGAEIVTSNEKLNAKKIRSSQSHSYQLDLIGTYKTISTGYSETFLKDLESINLKNIFFNTGIFPKGIGLLAGISGALSRKEALKLALLSSVALKKKTGEIYGAFNSKNRMIAAVLFLSSHYKTNIVYAVQSREGKRNKAIYGLIDHYIKQHSEKALTMDFQGLHFLEDEFFESIGAVKYPLYRIRVK